MPKENKVSNIEMELRLQVVAGLICKEYSPKQIWYYVNSPPVDKKKGKLRFESWNVNERQIRNYIAKCYQIFKDNIDQDIDTKIARHIAIRCDLFQTALEAGDMTNALKIQQDIANLQGLYKLTIESRSKQEITITSAPRPETISKDNPNAGINGADNVD